MQDLTITYLEIVGRLLVAVALCGVIGFERETRDQSAGFRTHILLGLGAALFTLVSAYGFENFTAAALRESGGIQFDPTRIAAQVVTGIGFLGAGAIIRQGMDIRGLTTAASLWTAAAIGMAAGAGYLFGAAATTAIVILALYLLRKFQSMIVPRFRTDFGVLNVTFEEAGGEVSTVVDILDRNEIRVRSMDAEIEGGEARYTLQLRIPPGRNVQELLDEVSTLPGIRRVGITGLHDIE